MPTAPSILPCRKPTPLPLISDGFTNVDLMTVTVTDITCLARFLCVGNPEDPISLRAQSMAAGRACRPQCLCGDYDRKSASPRECTAADKLTHNARAAEMPSTRGQKVRGSCCIS
jgi:hypothetical protein